MKKTLITAVIFIVCFLLQINSIDVIATTTSENGTSIEITDGEINETGKAVVSSGNGYLTVIAHVNADINETVYIQFFNIDTYKEYAYYLYKINEYKTNIELPAGNYIVSGGGLPNDTKGIYPVEEKQFTISPASATLLEVGIGMEPNQIGSYASEYELVEVTKAEELYEEAKDVAPIEVAQEAKAVEIKEVKIGAKQIIGSIITGIVLVVALLLILKGRED